MKAQTLFKFAAIILGLTLALIQPSNGARILSVSFITSKSHKITYDPILRELARRGHEVVSLSPVPYKGNSTNPREILTIDFDEMMKNGPDVFQMKLRGETFSPFSLIHLFEKFCLETYALPQVQEILSQKFDLVFHEPFMNECTAGFLYRLNTSLVLFTPFSVPTYFTRPLGGPAPPSFIPNLFVSYGDRMTFKERVLNFLGELTMVVMNSIYFVPCMEAVYREALNDSTVPGAVEILKNASLLLSNSHFSLGGIRPFMPDVIEVGGMHLREAKPLPKALEDFVNSSGEHGFIFFSMGSILQGSNMPEPHRHAFLKAFSQLKQKVLWKWETETMPDLPPNVKLIKWAPQQDILGHPKCRLFITHGGLGSLTESVYHGVPTVGIPMFGDQLTNIQKFVRMEIAVEVDFSSVSEKDILGAVQTVLTDPKYEANVKGMAKIFSDQRDDPLERAIYWIEYVLRHKGALHLRSPARDLNAFQYYSLDVISVILLSIAVILYVLYAIMKILLRLFGIISSREQKGIVTIEKKLN